LNFGLQFGAFHFEFGVFIMISIEQIKQLREETAVSMAECRKALEEAKGDIEKAKEVLRKRGQELAGKKSSRETSQGIVTSYIHANGKIGVLLDLRCESDFVAKSKEFQELAHEICLQIAAMKPLFLKEEEIKEEFLDGERKIYREQLKDSGKSRKILEQVIEGKLKKYREGVSLLSQIWVKDQTKTVDNLIKENIAKIGENITIKRFSRYEI
jgi:elongation factor Ts